MRKAKAFRDVESAPRDGTVIEVLHGPSREIVRARWSGRGQAWVRDDDPLLRALHGVTGWRPAG